MAAVAGVCQRPPQWQSRKVFVLCLKQKIERPFLTVNCNMIQFICQSECSNIIVPSLSIKRQYCWVKQLEHELTLLVSLGAYKTIKLGPVRAFASIRMCFYEFSSWPRLTQSKRGEKLPKTSEVVEPQAWQDSD
jgi:hypothetical protein